MKITVIKTGNKTYIVKGTAKVKHLLSLRGVEFETFTYNINKNKPTKIK